MVFPRLKARPAWLPLLVLVMLSGCKTGQKLSLCSFSKPAKSSCTTTCTSKPKVEKSTSCAPVEKWGGCGAKSNVVCQKKAVCGPKVTCTTTACVPAKVGCTSKTSCAATCVPVTNYVRPQVQPKSHTEVIPMIVPKTDPHQSKPTPVAEPFQPVIEQPNKQAKPKTPAVAVPKKPEATENYDGADAPPFPMNPAIPPVPPQPTTMRLQVPARTASNTSPFRPVIIPGGQSIEVPVAIPEPVAIDDSNPFDELSPATISKTQPVAAPKNNLSSAWADAVGLEDDSQIRETPILTESVPDFRRGENQPQIATPDGWRSAPARVVENIEEIPERN